MIRWAFVMSMAVGCGSQARSLVGTLPPEASGVHAVDAAGARTDGAMDGASFSIALDRGPAVDVLVEVDGAEVPLRFAESAGGAPSRSSIPDFSGEIDLGALTLHSSLFRAATTGAEDEWAESEENPLDEVDSDDDGESDLEDEDDDDDGTEDDEDEDDDGDGEDEDDDSESESETETETEI